MTFLQAGRPEKTEIAGCRNGCFGLGFSFRLLDAELSVRDGPAPQLQVHAGLMASSSSSSSIVAVQQHVPFGPQDCFDVGSAFSDSE